MATQTVTESLVTVRGAQVRILQAGHGKPLLYLHDETDPGTWQPAHEAWAADYTVHRPDLPGFNHSERRTDVDTIADLAHRMWDVADEQGLDQIRLIGNSIGGWLAADMATIDPTRVTHLVLLSPAGIRPTTGFPTDIFVNPTEPRNIRNQAATAKLAWNPYFHDPHLPARLHRIKAKTLIIHGDQDTIIPPECGKHYANHIKSAQLHLIAECGHQLTERTADVLALTTPFLAD